VIFKGLSRIRTDKLFMLDHENTKGSRGHCLKLRKTRCTRDITRHFPIGWSISLDGTCWISGQSMHLAWMHWRTAYI